MKKVEQIAGNITASFLAYSIRIRNCIQYNFVNNTKKKSGIFLVDLKKKWNFNFSSIVSLPVLSAFCNFFPVFVDFLPFIYLFLFPDYLVICLPVSQFFAIFLRSLFSTFCQSFAIYFPVLPNFLPIFMDFTPFSSFFLLPRLFFLIFRQFSTRFSRL